MMAYNDACRDTSVDGHFDTQASKQQFAVLAGFQLCLGLLQQLGGPGRFQKGQLDMQGPAYGVYGIMESPHEGITLC